MNSQQEHNVQVPLNEILISKSKNAKEITLREISHSIYALLNTDGGTVVLCFSDDGSDTSMVQTFGQKKSEFVRMIEQLLINSIGSQLVSSNVSFDHSQDSTVCKVRKCNSFITTNYNLYVPSETQANPVSSLERIVDTILNRQLVQQPVLIGSHHQLFKPNENCGVTENKAVELKFLKACPSKRTTLADRITGKGNKFCCYVSAFANHNGGHIYYGIRDDGTVEGEWIPIEQDKNEITKKVEKAINKMIWPQQTGNQQPKRGVHWDIFFEPVLDEDSNPIPSTFVIVIYIAPCLGGVFTEKPECYEMVEGKVEEMSFVAWKKRMLSFENSNDQSNAAEVVPYQISRIQWSSDEMKQVCTSASNVLMNLINNGKWKELVKMAGEIQQENPVPEVRLMVLSKMVIACSRQSHFHKAKIYLGDFYEILRKINDRPIFKALASYLEIVLKRNQKDFKDIEKVLADALANAELIESGFLTAAIHLLVATVSSFKDQESGLIQDKLSRTAIEHLQRVEKENSVTRDMQQKAYITLVFSSLKCVLSKDLILVARCTETDLNKAKSALSAFNETTFGNPPSRYREIQTKLANSVFYYRQAQLKEDLTETRDFLEWAINYANDAKELAKKLAFGEMICWSETLILACTVALVHTQSNSRNQH